VPGLLDGITVVDLSSVGPASRASRWLADFGAEVVKVGPIPSAGDVVLDAPEHAYAAQRGLRRILLDLKSPGGSAVMRQLVGEVDVLLESFRPGVMARLGLEYASVRDLNPRIVYCSTSGYGADGPWAAWAGHDLNYVAASGLLSATGRGPDGRPPVLGATIADAAGGGLHAVASILAALVARSLTGEGRHLDVSILDGMVALMALPIDQYLATGEVTGPASSLLTGRYACYGVYRCADDRWLSVAAIEPRFWANLCRALGCDRWIGAQLDDDVRAEVRGDLERAFLTRARDDWVRTLAPADTCVAPVQSIDEVGASEHLRARRTFVTAESPGTGRVEQVGPCLAGMQPADEVYELPGGRIDTDDVLSELGLTAQEIDQLRTEGSIA